MTNAASSIFAEAEALKWRVETMTSFDYKNIIFESDYLSLVKMINGSEEVQPVLQPIIDVTRLTLLQIQSYVVRVYLRSGNKISDRISKESFTSVQMLLSYVM